MKRLSCSAAVLAGLVSFAVHAAPPAGAIDVYYVVSPEIEADVEGLGELTLDEGDGIGVKGRFDLNPQIFIAGEYQANEYDEVEGISVDAQFDQIRGGLGFRLGADSPFYLLGEVISVDLEVEDEGSDETGYGAHIGFQAPVADMLSLYGQAGYVDVDADGFEVLGGAALMFSPTFGAFVDYRHTELESDQEEDTFKDLRVGLRIALN